MSKKATAEKTEEIGETIEAALPEKPSLPVKAKTTPLKEMDLRDLNAGWLLDNGKNQLLVTRYNKDEWVTQPSDSAKPYGGRNRFLVEGDQKVLYIIGTELKSRYQKIEEQGSLDKDDFIKFVLKNKYAFVKKV